MSEQQLRGKTSSKQLKRGKTGVKEWRLVLVLYLIGLEGGASFQEQSKLEEMQKQYNSGLLSTVNYKLFRGILESTATRR